MGNRAVITTGKGENEIAVYLHWNGGPESVLAFLEVCKQRGFRCPKSDNSYGMARLIGVIHEFFGITSSTSLGVGTVGTVDCDNFDNGVYQLGAQWTVEKRWGKGHDMVTQPNALTKDQLVIYNGIIEQLTINEKETV